MIGPIHLEVSGQHHMLIELSRKLPYLNRVKIEIVKQIPAANMLLVGSSSRGHLF